MRPLTMKTEVLHPAHLAFDEAGQIYAPAYGDRYHPAIGAQAQAEHVFLRGNGLPQRWATRQRFVILETGFGLGNNFLATWAAWRVDPHRCERLVYLGVEKHPLRREDLRQVHSSSAWPDLAAQLQTQWPVLTPNLHLLDFEGGRVQLILALGDARQMLGELQAEVDAYYLDGFAPSKNPEMWSADIFKRLARLAAPGATVATWTHAQSVRDGLSQQGFEVAQAPGFASQPDMTVARYAPRYTPPQPAALRPAASGVQSALILGAGLAGCAAAWGLAQQGWPSTVLDRQPEPALETSGNPGGLMHGIFNAPDSLHARWFRAAALHTERWARPALLDGSVAGQLQGLLRLDHGATEPAELAQAQARLDSVGLDAAYLALLGRASAAVAAGLPVPDAAWYYRQAGWLSPRDWSRWFLAQSHGLARFRGGQAVRQIRRSGALWQALDAQGRLMAQAPVLVLAHALGARQVWPAGLAPLALQAFRGQTTLLPLLPGAAAPARPISGQGYALQLTDSHLLLGATSQLEDMDPALRVQDHAYNLQRAGLLGLAPTAPVPEGLSGRVGWRASTADRLPLIGPPVDAERLTQARSQRHRLDALRHQPRLHDAEHGLYLCTGLGSRGLTSAALAARVLAAWITGAPFPLENSLRDALDPARG
jgi:tRNA 5-methylaminomethyl-2-thiouridine biosynthesis bifunctional protein